MTKLKVMTIVGTRPEIIRLSRVLCALDRSFEHILVHTGQNYDYELNQIFFEDLELRRPDIFLNAAGDTAAETIGRIIEKVDSVYAQHNPDAILILGDTNSCLSAIPAKRRKIPIFHMEAGNRSFDQRVPEETNRKIVDHISDINMPYSDIAREYLLKEGLPADRIIKTGSPMFEVLGHYKNKINDSKILSKLQLSEKKFFMVSCHREENVDSLVNLNKFASSLNVIAEKYNLPIIVSTHPRTRKRIDEARITLHPLVQTLKPMSFTDYVKLQLSALATLSDSGTITEESSILGIPAVNIRESHERPEGMEEASVIMSGLSPERVMQAIELTLRQHEQNCTIFQLVNDYKMPNVSEKVVRIILSYTDYVNRNVWRKN